MKTLQVLTVLFLGALLALPLGAQAADKKEAPPSFKPGADVVLAFELKAPKDWHFNEGMPVTLGFDTEYLKTAPLTTKTTSLSVEFKPGATLVEVELPIKLKNKLEDGELEVPVSLSCVICDESGASCLMVSESISATLIVMSKAPKDSKNQAQAKGANPVTHTISAPVVR